MKWKKTKFDPLFRNFVFYIKRTLQKFGLKIRKPNTNDVLLRWRFFGIQSCTLTKTRHKLEMHQKRRINFSASELHFWDCLIWGITRTVCNLWKSVKQKNVLPTFYLILYLTLVKRHHREGSSIKKCITCTFKGSNLPPIYQEKIAIKAKIFFLFVSLSGFRFWNAPINFMIPWLYRGAICCIHQPWM